MNLPRVELVADPVPIVAAGLLVPSPLDAASPSRTYLYICFCRESVREHELCLYIIRVLCGFRYAYNGGCRRVRWGERFQSRPIATGHHQASVRPTITTRTHPAGDAAKVSKLLHRLAQRIPQRLPEWQGDRSNGHWGERFSGAYSPVPPSRRRQREDCLSRLGATDPGMWSGI